MVTASLEFVCIRPATYEDASEGKLLQSVFPARGSLENTVFCLFAPDGETKLSRSGRSPGMVFRSPENFLAALKEISARYPRRKNESRSLPTIPDARLALNEAACDSAPLAIAVGKSEAERKQLEQALGQLAWNERFAGRLRYTSMTVEGAQQLDWLKDKLGQLGKSSGLVVVEPNAFGTEAQLLSSVKTTEDQESLAKALASGLEAHAPEEKDARQHIAEGRRAGIEWESKLPVTDPDENRRAKRGPRERKP